MGWRGGRGYLTVEENIFFGFGMFVYRGFLRGCFMEGDIVRFYDWFRSYEVS